MRTYGWNTLRLMLGVMSILMIGCNQPQTESTVQPQTESTVSDPNSSAAIDLVEAGKAAIARGDYRKAAKIIRILAERQDIRGGPIQVYAAFNIGKMYLEGEGVPQDYVEAEKWIRKAAEQHLSIAQYELAQMYNEGRGVPKDYVQAHKWSNLAAASSDNTIRTTASALRSRISGEMTAAKIAEAQNLAREWKRKCWDGSVAPEGQMC